MEGLRLCAPSPMPARSLSAGCKTQISRFESSLCASQLFVLYSPSLLQNEKKFELLKHAIDSHNKYMTDASEGKGVDRHLLGLMMCSLENNESPPPFFSDPSFGVSKHFKLSTSNLSPAPAFIGGFGPVVDDGYGVCYGLRSTSLWFSVSSRTSCHSTDTRQMMRALDASLNEIMALCLSLKKPAKL